LGANVDRTERLAIKSQAQSLNKQPEVNIRFIFLIFKKIFTVDKVIEPGAFKFSYGQNQTHKTIITN